MNRPDRTDAPEESGFFGAERARPAEEIEPEIWARIDDHLASHDGGPERLIPLLHLVQQALGSVPFAVQESVADKLGLSPIQVYGVVSFYPFFTTTPRGDHRIKVCTGTACFVRHARGLVETVRRTLGVGLDGLTEDRRFRLECVRCLGACRLAPAVVVDDEAPGRLSPGQLRDRLLALESRASNDEPPEASEGSGE